MSWILDFLLKKFPPPLISIKLIRSLSTTALSYIVLMLKRRFPEYLKNLNLMKNRFDHLKFYDALWGFSDFCSWFYFGFRKQNVCQSRLRSEHTVMNFPSALQTEHQSAGSFNGPSDPQCTAALGAVCVMFGGKCGGEVRGCLLSDQTAALLSNCVSSFKLFQTEPDSPLITLTRKILLRFHKCFRPL